MIGNEVLGVVDENVSITGGVKHLTTNQITSARLMQLANNPSHFKVLEKRSMANGRGQTPFKL